MSQSIWLELTGKDKIWKAKADPEVYDFDGIRLLK